MLTHHCSGSRVLGAIRTATSFLLTAVCALAVVAPSTAASQDGVFGHGFEAVGPPNREEAARFLNQATFGATSSDIERLMVIGYDSWFVEQFSRPRGRTHQQWYSTDRFSNPALANDGRVNMQVSAWYSRTVHADDQLRQRMAWALSQIFVVSGLSTPVSLSPYQFLPSYMDLLNANAFGEYRTVLENVTLNPLMGHMLTYIGNRETSVTTADQNFAREVLQLFSIGLYELNQDGSLRLDTEGKPIETYSLADIVGLARVFTGLNIAFGAVGEHDLAPFTCGPGGTNNVLWFACPMSVHGYHSMAEKRFLGITIPANQATSAQAVFAQGRNDLRIALDRIAGHPNVAPFISRQLIQRFTTSNPSPAYVRRVADVFADNGSGVRGDFKAVVRAILLDPEARDPVNARSQRWGKVREPILAATQMMRVLRARDASGNVWSGNQNCINGLDTFAEVSERPFHAPNVFNFYRPGFVAPNTESAQAGMVAPELQITDTVNFAHWARYVTDSLGRGGTGGSGDCVVTNLFSYAELWGETVDAARLVDQVLLLFTPGAATPELRAGMLRAVQSVSGNTEQARLNRLRIALSIALINPEYRVQR